MRATKKGKTIWQVYIPARHCFHFYSHVFDSLVCSTSEIILKYSNFRLLVNEGLVHSKVRNIEKPRHVPLTQAVLSSFEI
jgi:hypothetical protein